MRATAFVDGPRSKPYDKADGGTVKQAGKGWTMATMMVTSRELREHTAKVLADVAKGRSVIVTRRGTPVAEVKPLARATEARGLRPYEKAWTDIEKTLRSSKPRFGTWQAAEKASRRR